MHAADVLAAAFAALPGLGHRLDSVVAALESRARVDALHASAEGSLHPDHAYSPEQAAAFLGILPASVLKVSKVLLPRVRSGRILGIDILAYRGDIEPDDARAYKASTRARIAGR